MANFIECNREQQSYSPRATRLASAERFSVAYYRCGGRDGPFGLLQEVSCGWEGTGGLRAFDEGVAFVVCLQPGRLIGAGRLNGCVSGTLGFALSRRTIRRITRRSADFNIDCVVDSPDGLVQPIPVKIRATGS